MSVDQIRSLAALEGDAASIDRMAYLAERTNEGELSDSEQAEYEAWIEANNLVAILKAEAQYRLNSAGN